MSEPVGRSVPSVGVKPGRRRALVRDAALWAVFATLATLENLVSHPQGAPWWEVAVGVAGLAAAVAVSRRHPLVAAAVVAALHVLPYLRLLTEAGPFPVTYLGALMVMTYLAGRRMPRARPALILLAVMGVGGVVVAIGANVTRGVADGLTYGILNWVVTMPLLLVPWLVGRYRRLYVELVSAGWERAEHLEREQRITVERERLRERTRIAEDMHDSLGHELSLIALRAGALELAPDLAERHRQAAADLRIAAANATDQLHDVIGVLRDGGSAAPTEPVRGDIADLVARAEASGMAVTLAAPVDGEPAPPMVARAAYRVVQEALTNVTKHAPGAAVTVRVTRSDDDTTVTVRNTAARGVTPPAGTSGGRGLLGLAERVRLLGGTLRTGPAGDGFEVVAVLPHTGAATPDPEPAADTPSESADHQARVRQRVRRSLIAAIVAPAGVIAGMLVLLLCYYVFAAYNSVLTPADYEALQLGQERAAMVDVLPPLQMFDAPSERLPAPPGARCEFYRPAGAPGTITYAYRLCFVDGRLVAKDLVPTGGRQLTPSPTVPTPTTKGSP